MTADKTVGLVLRAVDFSETSKVVTFFTRDFGKIAVMAKGGRRLKSRFEVALDLLSVCSIGVIRKPAAELDLLTEAVLEERFMGLRKNLKALYAGYYLAETLDGLTHPHEPHPRLYEAATATLGKLAAGDDWMATLVEYGVEVISDLGYRPCLEGCVSCRGPVPVSDRLGYSIRAGGLVCDRCTRVTPGVIRLPRDLVHWLRDRFASNGSSAGGPPPAAHRLDLWRLLSSNLEHLMGRRSKTAPMLRDA